MDDLPSASRTSCVNAFLALTTDTSSTINAVMGVTAMPLLVFAAVT